MFKEVSTAFPLFSLSLETFVACCKGLKVMSDEKQKDDFVLAVVAKQDTIGVFSVSDSAGLYTGLSLIPHTLPVITSRASVCK